jgi:hypothetical protein
MLMSSVEPIEDQLIPTRTENPWEDLVISILAVNQYSLEKTYVLLDGLRKAGLTDPENLAVWEQSEIVSRLNESGCNRGVFMTGLFALRLGSLGVAARARGIDEFTRILLSKDFGEIDRLLLPINGIGPKVLRNFRLLYRAT